MEAAAASLAAVDLKPAAAITALILTTSATVGRAAMSVRPIRASTVTLCAMPARANTVSARRGPTTTGTPATADAVAMSARGEPPVPSASAGAQAAATDNAPDRTRQINRRLSDQKLAGGVLTTKRAPRRLGVISALGLGDDETCRWTDELGTRRLGDRECGLPRARRDTQ